MSYDLLFLAIEYSLSEVNTTWIRPPAHSEEKRSYTAFLWRYGPLHQICILLCPILLLQSFLNHIRILQICNEIYKISSLFYTWNIGHFSWIVQISRLWNSNWMVKIHRINCILSIWEFLRVICCKMFEKSSTHYSLNKQTRMSMVQWAQTIWFGVIFLFGGLSLFLRLT